MQINIVCYRNGVGLQKDAAIIEGLLSRAGHRTAVMPPYPFTYQPADVAICCEHAIHSPGVGRHIFLPNPEWFSMEAASSMPDWEVWCKTNDAKAVFDRFRPRPRSVEYLGFTSVDQYQRDVPRKREVLHLGGASIAKGTAAVYEAWCANPTWPTLHLVRHGTDFKPQPNVKIYNNYLTDDAVKSLLNGCLFHLCPSSYEGFGHYINEALSVGAIVTTTGAPPMSELAPADVGFHISPTRKTLQNVATHKHVSAQAITNTMETVLALDEEDIKRRSEAARQLYLDRDARFKARFLELLAKTV